MVPNVLVLVLFAQAHRNTHTRFHHVNSKRFLWKFVLVYFPHFIGKVRRAGGALGSGISRFVLMY